MDSDTAKLKEPEDAQINSQMPEKEEKGAKSSNKTQDTKTSEVSFKYDVSVALPQTVTMELAPKTATMTAPMDVPSGPPVKRNDLLFRKNPEPKLENGFLVTAAVDPGFCGIRGVIPISSSKAWIHNMGTILLIDIEKSEITKRYSPDIFIRSLYVIGDSVVVASEDDDVLYKVHGETSGTDLNVMFEQNLNITKVTDDKAQNVQAYTFSRTGDYFFIVLSKKESCLCAIKTVQYIQKYTTNGQLVQSRKLRKGIMKQYYFKNIAAMTVNWNHDICIAGNESSDIFSSTMAVFAPDFKHRFSFQRNAHIFSVTVDPWHNILFSVYGSVHLVKSDGRLSTCIEMNFGDDGKVKRIFVDDKGERAWICTEIPMEVEEKVVVIEYSSLLDATGLSGSFKPEGP